MNPPIKRQPPYPTNAPHFLYFLEGRFAGRPDRWQIIPGCFQTMKAAKVKAGRYESSFPESEFRIAVYRREV